MNTIAPEQTTRAAIIEAISHGDMSTQIATLSAYLSSASWALRACSDELDKDAYIRDNATQSITETLGDIIAVAHDALTRVAAGPAPTTILDAITVEDARHILWAYGHHADGYEAGSFTSHLISALQHADAYNTQTIARAYPGLALGVSLMRNLPDGAATLIEIINDSRSES